MRDMVKHAWAFLYVHGLTQDVADLFSRVEIGTKVVVLAKNSPHLQARAIEPVRTEARTASIIPAAGARSRPAVATVFTGRQAMNLY